MQHVDIIERDVKCIGIDYKDNIDDGESKESDANTNYDLSDNDFESADEYEEQQGKATEKNDLFLHQPSGKCKETKNPTLEVPRKSTRRRKSPVRYSEKESFNIYLRYCRVDTPCTFEEAMNSKVSKNWQEAMNKEIECINKNKTWTLFDRVKNKKIIDVKWVYTRKSDNRYKARLVVRGFQQTDVIDDIYSPVAKNQTLKLLLSYCCQNGLRIEQMDVETAFLNGKVTTEVYVNKPKGYEDGTERVYKLSKALYELTESPRDWYECYDEYGMKLGFRKSNVELCLYIHGKDEYIVYILIYVDDLMICGKDEKKIQRIKKLFSDRSF